MATVEQIAKKATDKMMVEIDPNELACRILEGMIGVKRPAGKTPVQALQELPLEDRAGLIQAAMNATLYITECMTKGQKLQ